MLELADLGFITATDLADYLVKKHSMSFRKAYQKTASIVNFAEKNKKKLVNLTLTELNKIEPKLTDDVFPNNWISFHKNGNVYLLNNSLRNNIHISPSKLICGRFF